MNKSVFIVVLLLSYNAIANSSFLIGNGGDIVVCEEGSTGFASTRLLDFVEFETTYGVSIELPKYKSVDDEIEDINTVLDIMFSRLSFFGDDLSDILKRYNKDFFKEARFLEDIELTDVTDSFHVLLPKSCEVTQIAIQRTPQFRLDPRYILDKALWDALDIRDKAGLVFHELLYRLLITSGRHPETIHSQDVRALTAIVFSDRVADFFSLEEFAVFINEKIGLDCPNFKKSEDGKTFQCLTEQDSKTVKNKREHLLANTWTIEFRGKSIPRRRTLWFDKDYEFTAVDICMFSESPIEPVRDIVIKGTYPVKITEHEFFHTKTVVERVDDSLTGAFCTVEFENGQFFEYEFLDKDTLVVDDVWVYTRVDKEDRG